MSAQAVQHPKSGRFIRVYLLTWGLLAAGGLTYLASLAWHVDLRMPQEQVAQPAIDPALGLRVANKALAEVDNVQQTVGEIQKDLGRLKDAVGQHDAQEREAQSRLAALEERVSTLATPAPPPAVSVITIPSAKQKAADKAKAAAEKRAAEQRATSRVVSVVEEPKEEPPAAASAPEPAPPSSRRAASQAPLPPSRSASRR